MGRPWDAPLRRTPNMTDGACTGNERWPPQGPFKAVCQRLLHKKHAGLTAATFLPTHCFSYIFVVAAKMMGQSGAIWGVDPAAPPRHNHRAARRIVGPAQEVFGGMSRGLLPVPFPRMPRAEIPPRRGPAFPACPACAAIAHRHRGWPSHIAEAACPVRLCLLLYGERTHSGARAELRDRESAREAAGRRHETAGAVFIPRAAGGGLAEC